MKKTHPVSWSEFHRDTKILIRETLIKQSWKGIIAITRGGLVPAAIIAREMNIRIIDTLCISAYSNKEIKDPKILKVPEQATHSQGKEWLLIDDLVDTGTTAKCAKQIMPKIHVATVYAKPLGLPWVDSYTTCFDQDIWLYFPWDIDIQYTKPIIQTYENIP